MKIIVSSSKTGGEAFASRWWLDKQDLESAIKESLEVGESRMRGANRLPQISEVVLQRALDIPKSEWIEMYFDLYRAAEGEDRLDDEIMKDAEDRRQILFHKFPKAR